MKKVRGGEGIWMRDLLIIFAAVLVFIIALTRGSFLSLRNFQSVAFQIPEFSILTFAMLLPMIAGGINLSTVATAGLSGIAATVFLTQVARHSTPGMQIWMFAAALTIALGVSVLCGLINGFLVAYVGVSPILVTVGTLTLFNGISLGITKGNELSGLPEFFLSIGNGTVWGIPISFLILVAVGLLIAYLMSTQYGFKLNMIGANPTACFYSGINNTAILLRTYVISGALCGIASIIMISRYNSAKPDYGSSYILQSILAVILGGTDVRGGYGNVEGTIMAIIILQMISSGFNMSGIPSNNYIVDVIWGALLIAIISVNLLRDMRKAGKKSVG